MYEENEYLESDVVNAAAMRLLPSLSNIEAEQSVLGSILYIKSPLPMLPQHWGRVQSDFRQWRFPKISIAI